MVRKISSFTVETLVLWACTAHFLLRVTSINYFTVILPLSYTSLPTVDADTAKKIGNNHKVNRSNHYNIVVQMKIIPSLKNYSKNRCVNKYHLG